MGSTTGARTARRIRQYGHVKAIVLDGFGGPEVLKLGDVEAPVAGAGRVLVAVHATSVNRPDVVQRQGHYPPPPGESPILGLEAAGTVEAVGDGVTGFARGERVLALLGGGGYAELAAAHAGHVMRMPESLSRASISSSRSTGTSAVFLLRAIRSALRQWPRTR